MLFMLQEFGRAEVARLGEMPTLQAAHAATFLELAESAVPKLYTHEQIGMAARLRREADNLRRALRWALEQEDVETATRFGACLWRFWLLSGLLNEGRQWLTGILARVGHSLEGAETDQKQLAVDTTQPLQVSRLAEMLYGLGKLAYRQVGSRRPEVAHWFRQSRDLFLQIGDEPRAALAVTALGQASVFLHEDLAVSQRQLDDSLAILREADHKTGMAENLYAQTKHYLYLDQPDQAGQAMRHSLALLREAGNIHDLAHAIQFAGDLALGSIGDYASVRRQNDEAAEMFAALGDVTEAAYAKARVGVMTGLIDQDWTTALGLVEAGRRVAQEHGNERRAASCTAMAALVYGSLGRYAEAKSVALEALRSAFSLSDHLTGRTALIGLALAERLEGDLVSAVATISAILSYRTRYAGLSFTRGNSLRLTALSRLKRELDSALFAQAWARGPARLAEWLPEPDLGPTPWSLAAVPETDTLETPGQGQMAASAGSEVPGSPLPAPEPLTAREKDVLNCLVQGMTDPQIAEALVVSPRTVHAHLRSIYGKLGVHTRTAATRLALEHGLL
jgi:DNA-binding CsgD family transcriptional regulator/tetratricopeptide (TPR) repeat protein